MNKHKRSKMLSMTKIWRRKVKRVPSSYTKMQERTPCEITNKQMTKLSINSPHQVETASEHLEETMKIEEVPDTSRQPTSWVSSKSVSTTGKNDETATNNVEFQELRSTQQAFKSIKNWNFLQPASEIEWLTITQDFLKGFPNVHSEQKLQLIIAHMKFHVEAKKMALLKLHRTIEEENGHPLVQFFQWITVNYEMSKRQKMVLLQKNKMESQRNVAYSKNKKNKKTQ